MSEYLVFLLPLAVMVLGAIWVSRSSKKDSSKH